MKTASQIFEKNQLLTLEVAKGLIGKTISVTNPEYKENEPTVRTAKLLGIESEWEWAARQDHSHLDNGKWATRQDYWKSFMDERRIQEFQNRLKLVSDVNLYCTCDLTGDSFFDEPTFFGSDADRPVFYIVEDEI